MDFAWYNNRSTYALGERVSRSTFGKVTGHGRYSQNLECWCDQKRASGVDVPVANDLSSATQVMSPIGTKRHFMAVEQSVAFGTKRTLIGTYECMA
jgi:hypothetical protein